MSYDEHNGIKPGEHLKSDDEVIREAFGHRPLQHVKGTIWRPSESDIYVGSTAVDLPEQASEFDFSRRKFDEEDKYGSDALARQLHNHRGFQAFFDKLAQKTERYETERVNQYGENGVPVHHPSLDITQLRDDIAEDIEKEFYNELAARGAKQKQVGPEDVRNVMAEKVAEYSSVSRLDLPYDELDVDLNELWSDKNEIGGYDSSDFDTGGFVR